MKRQKDLVSRAMEHVVKMDESGITDLMIQIEAEYERKYGEKKADGSSIVTLQQHCVVKLPHHNDSVYVW